MASFCKYISFNSNFVGNLQSLNFAPFGEKWLFGLEIKFSGNAYNAYEELFEQIEPKINQLINTNQSKFMSVLYRIDLSDVQINKAINENSSETFSAIISDLIIKRELQKVVIRKQFNNKNA